MGIQLVVTRNNKKGSVSITKDLWVFIEHITLYEILWGRGVGGYRMAT